MLRKTEDGEGREGKNSGFSRQTRAPKPTKSPYQNAPERVGGWTVTLDEGDTPAYVRVVSVTTLPPSSRFSFECGFPVPKRWLASLDFFGFPVPQRWLGSVDFESQEMTGLSDLPKRWLASLDFCGFPVPPRRLASVDFKSLPNYSP